MSFTIRVPGKLLLAGEYAILSPGALALVLAVNRYLDLHLKPAAQYSVSSQLIDQPWTFTGLNDLSTAPPVLNLLQAALQVGAAYLGDRLREHGPFAIEIESDLNFKQIKLGLGSSSSTCVAVIAALLHWVGQDLAAPEVKLRLFKLALLAHRQVQQQGSGADIAANIYGAVTAYTSPDLAHLPQRAQVAEFVDQHWPLLAIERLDWPAAIPLLIGWTGEPASSPDYLALYQTWLTDDPELADRFLFSASVNTLGLRQALETGSQESMISGLSQARRVLQMLDDDGQHMYQPQRIPMGLETPALAALADCAEQLQGAGKFSGAGGGDCGLAVVPEHAKAELLAAWQTCGIQPLELELDTIGARVL